MDTRARRASSEAPIKWAGTAPTKMPPRKAMPPSPQHAESKSPARAAPKNTPMMTVENGDSIIVARNVLPVRLTRDQETGDWTVDWNDDVPEIGVYRGVVLLNVYSAMISCSNILFSLPSSGLHEKCDRVSFVGVPDVFVPDDEQVRNVATYLSEQLIMLAFNFG